MYGSNYFVCLHVVAHPWLRDEQPQIPLDLLVFKLVEAYIRLTPLKQAALKVFFFMLYISFNLLKLAS